MAFVSKGLELDKVTTKAEPFSLVTQTGPIVLNAKAAFLQWMLKGPGLIFSDLAAKSIDSVLLQYLCLR